MRSLLPLAVCCISLSLQQLRALPAEERPGGNRLDLLKKFIGPREDTTLSAGGLTDDTVPSSPPSPSLKWPGILRPVLASKMRRIPPWKLAWAQPTDGSEMRLRRARRHAHSSSRGGHAYPHHAQLMRVGCNLGTCQVQNLSHRLYQLIGQSGREDSSPINPRSPHSYG